MLHEDWGKTTCSGKRGRHGEGTTFTFPHGHKSLQLRLRPDTAKGKKVKSKPGKDEGPVLRQREYNKAHNPGRSPFYLELQGAVTGGRVVGVSTPPHQNTEGVWKLEGR